jgi:ribonuclease MRP protein subunit RMP1
LCEGRWSKEEEANLSSAFSNLVADNQYSALGLVLLGCLARVKSVIRQFVEDEKIEGTDSEAEVEGDVVMELKNSENERQDDLGEVVDRREILGHLEGPLDDDDEVSGDGQEELEEQIAPETTEEAQRVTISKPGKKKRMGPLVDRDEVLTRETATPSKPPKKKRKKGDAFDDLFSSLI